MGKYLYNQAIAMIRKHRITHADLKKRDQSLEHTSEAENLYHNWGYAILPELGKMRPEQLGRIIVQGKNPHDIYPGTSLYEVPCIRFIQGRNCGRTLLKLIAGATIIAQMVDILRKQRERDEAATERAAT